MRAKAFGLAIGIACAATILAAPAHADDVAGYLDALHSRGIYSHDGDNGDLVVYGEALCEGLAAGYTPLQEAAIVYRNSDTTIDAEDAGFIVGAAIANLCPEFLYLIPSGRYA